MSLHPDLLLRAEAVLALILTLGLYAYRFPHHWLFLLAVLFVPDLSMLAYLGRNLRAASVLYNTAHTFVLPLALAGVGVVTERATLLQLALIWAAHIFADRALGYGLKFPQAFNPTHIQSSAIFPGSSSATASSPS